MSKRSPLTPPPIGFSAYDGDLSQFVGKYMNCEVALVYQEIGGSEGFADWARENRTDFYTKIVPKIMQRNVEHRASDGVEELLRRLDEQDRGVLIDGECTDVDETGA